MLGISFDMKLKCPYCDCEYDLHIDSLPSPIGDEKLGYGWWLRCCGCGKKWWLRSSFFQDMVNSPLIVPKEEKLNRLSQLRGQNQRKNKRKRWGPCVFKILIAIIIGIGIITVLFNKEVLYEKITEKVLNLSNNLTTKLTFHEIKYYIDDSNPEKVSIHVFGQISNNEKVVIKIKGIKVSIFDYDNNLTDEWIHTSEKMYIVSGETMEFHTEHQISNYKEIRVDVSIL